MPETVLTAETGRRTGSADARRLRAAGKIPAVVYGHGMEPLPIAVDRRELRLALSGSAGMNTVLDVTVDGAVYPSIIKEIQRHPVKRSVQHIDFLQVNLNEEIVVAVPLQLEGESKTVAQNQGLIDLAMQDLEVRTTPRSIPDSIVIDVSEFTMDTVIRVADITLPPGVTAEADDDAVLVTVIATRGGGGETSESADATDGGEAVVGSDDEGAADSDGE
jgi:large subunit ribosomal protein L25